MAKEFQLEGRNISALSIHRVLKDQGFDWVKADTKDATAEEEAREELP